MTSSSRNPMVLLFTLLTLLVNSIHVGAQVYTTTLPWIDGDTIVVSQSTNAAGVTLAIETLSTVAPITTGALRPTTTPLVATTTPLVPTTTPLVPTTTPLVPTTTPLVATTRPTTTTPARVTTDPLDDETTTTSRRRTTTSLAIVATNTLPSGEVRTVPAGTIMDYSEYQQSVNQAAQTGGTNPAMNGGGSNAASPGKQVGWGQAVGVVVGVLAGAVGVAVW